MKHRLNCIFLLCLLILLLSPFFINSFIDFFVKFKLIDICDINTWIGFYGSIIGGGLTIVGVIYTIKKQEEFNRQDKDAQNDLNEKNARISNFPNLNIDQVDTNDNYDNCSSLEICYGGNDVLGIIRIKNVSDHNAKNLRMQCIIKSQCYDSGMLCIYRGYIVKNDEYYVQILGNKQIYLQSVIPVDLYITFEDSLFHTYQIKIECILENDSGVKFVMPESNEFKLTFISENDAYIISDGDKTDYDLCENKKKFDKLFIESFEPYKDMFQKIDKVIFDKYAGSYNSGSLSGPRNFKLLSETQCLCYVKSEFFYHGKEVFVYSYEVLLDVNRNNAIYKHLKIEKNLRFCSLFQLLRIYILSLKIVF